MNRIIMVVALFAFLLVCLGLFQAFQQRPALRTDGLIQGPSVLVQGARGQVRTPAGLEIALTESGSRIPIASMAFQVSFQDSLRLGFPDERAIVFVGNGTLDVDAAGFKTRLGHFKSTFQCRGKDFRLAVPYAVMAIRGTSIRIDLENGSGSLLLIEGSVEVKPEDPSRPSFVWKSGETLQISPGAGVQVVPAGSTPPTPGRTPDPPEFASPGEEPTPQDSATGTPAVSPVTGGNGPPTGGSADVANPLAGLQPD